MSNNLRTYFPMIKEREAIISEIRKKEALNSIFDKWSEESKREFLDFCSGAKGVKILYDSFFKEVMNPEYAPNRLNEFLSLLLEQEVKIISVLPNDSARISDEGSLVIMDIVVELENGGIANVEVQKIGYKFPGQRSACYSSDLLLRQYKRVKDVKKNQFSYKDIKNVYTIVLFEKSTKEFHEFPDTYIHLFEQKSNTGVKLELLQKYLFIPLDIFKEKQQNKEIANKLDAWLTFFSTDNPEEIIRLIQKYPEFKLLYEDVYRICQNIEGVMKMFSEELRELDRNTVQLMIDEMHDEITELSDVIAGQKDTIAEQKDTIEWLNNEKCKSEEELRAALKRIAELETKQQQKDK